MMKSEEVIFQKWMLKGNLNYDSKAIEVFMSLQSEDRRLLFGEKDKQYGGSWQKDGQIGAFLNLKRKMDRVLQKWQDGSLFDMSEDSVGENNLDTLMDMDNYSQMLQGLMFLNCKTSKQFDIFVGKMPSLLESFRWSVVGEFVELKQSKEDEKRD